MPTISTFYGIAIQIFWRDHAPPHFHALYAEHEASIDIRVTFLDGVTGEVDMARMLASPQTDEPSSSRCVIRLSSRKQGS